MKITDITVEQFEAAENEYRERNPNPVKAQKNAMIAEERLLQTTLSIPAEMFEGAPAIVLGIEIGLILAEQLTASGSPTVVDQAVS